MKKLSNTEAELKKSVAYKKSVYLHVLLWLSLTIKTNPCGLNKFGINTFKYFHLQKGNFRPVRQLLNMYIM